MIAITKVDHIGIRVGEKKRATDFYELLGFRLITDTGFEKGHPIMMEHPSGVVLNLLGPSTAGSDENVLMDREEKYPGYTHMALRIESLADTKAFMAKHDIDITGSFSFKDMSAIFVRDPDRNVIEFDEYPGDNPASRLDSADDVADAFDDHP